MIDRQEAIESINESWQKADDVYDWLTKERRGRIEYQHIIGLLSEAMDYLDRAANRLEKLPKGKE